MAQEDLIVKGMIELVLKGQGAKEASVQMREAMGQAQQLQNEFKRTESATQSLWNKFGAYFTAGAFVAFARSAVLQFAEVERAINNLEAQLRTLGPAAGASVGQVQAFIRNLAETYHIIDDRIYPAFSRLLNVTGDARVAMDALSVAARFGRAGFGDLESNAQALAAVFQGSARAARQFGINIKEAADGGFSYAKIIELILEKEKALGPVQEDTQSAVEILKQKWDELLQSAGEGIVGVARATVMLFQAAAHPIELGKRLSENIKIYGDWKLAIQASIGEVADSHKSGEEEQTRTTQAESLKRLAAKMDTDTAAKKSAEDAAKAAKDLEEAESKALEDRMERRAARYDEQKKEDAKRLAAELEFNRLLLDILRKRKEEETRLAQAAFNADAEARLAEIDRQIADREYLNQATWDLQLEAVEAERALADQAAEDDYNRELENKQLTEEAKLALEEQYAARKAANDAKFSAAAIRLAKAEKDAKERMYLTAAQMAIDSLNTIFGENKATAIAQAIINTYEAVTKALTLPYPMNFVVAGLVSAAGMASVRKIMSTSPGGGGGGDVGASTGGGGGASFSPGHVSYPEGEAAAPSGGSSSSSSYELHFHGPVVGGNSGAQELVRFLKEAQRRDRGRYQS